MAITVFPSANGVGGAGQKVLKEVSLARWAHADTRDHVVSGFELTLNDPPTQATISPGTAIIDGRLITSDAPTVLDLNTGTGWRDTYVHLLTTSDALSCVATAEMITSTSVVLPPVPHRRALRLWEVRLYNNTLHNTYDLRTYGPQIAYPPHRSVRDAVTYETWFESTSPFVTTGTVAVSQGWCDITTGAVNGNSASIKRPCPDPDWMLIGDGNRNRAIIQMALKIDDPTSCEAYVGAGLPGTAFHVGMKLASGIWYLTHGTGTTEIVSTAGLAAVGGGVTMFTIDVDPATDLVSARDNVGGWQGSIADLQYLGMATLPAEMPFLYGYVKTLTDATRKLSLSWYRYYEGWES
jgi:hypothetical protein